MRPKVTKFPALAVSWLLLLSASASAQDSPWSKYFKSETNKIAAATDADLQSVTPETWMNQQAAWRTELRMMLGLEPLPERTDLNVTVTGTIHHTGLNIQRLHFQSRPGLYVAANLYLPSGEIPKSGWPAVLYVCGHARVEDNGRLFGNKTGYHHHGLWFARHGVACLIIDTVQLGELQGEHHGTYKLGRWDWVSRGYTPAGVEAWNALRAIDVLEAWPGIDAQRIGITGRSGGGAYSWFAAALDDRIRVAVPVAGITDLHNHIIDGCVTGHCDCMYFVNYYGWDYTKLAALIAPRPLLLANSDSDGIFPLDGVMRTHQVLAKHYAKLGATDSYGLLITPGPHQDTQELQVGAFKFLLRHLLGATPVIDTPALKELTPEQLAVFEREIPKDEKVTSLGQWFPRAAESILDPEQAKTAWQDKWLISLTDTALRLPLRELNENQQFGLVMSGSAGGGVGNWKLFQSDLRDGLNMSIVALEHDSSKPPVVHVGAVDDLSLKPESIERFLKSDEAHKLLAVAPDRTHYFIQSRASNWQTQVQSLKDRIQTVRRFYLLGQMPEQLALADTVCCLKWISLLGDQNGRRADQIVLTGGSRSAPLATIAALLCHSKVHPDLPLVAELVVNDYPHDTEAGPSLPGLSLVVDLASLLAAAHGSFNVKEQVTSESRGPQRLIDSSSEPQQATGMRLVEVGTNQVDIWLRATRWSLPNLGDMPAVSFEKPARNGSHNRSPILPAMGVDGLQFAVPGVAADVRVGHRRTSQGDWLYSEWAQVGPDSDYSKLIRIDDLEAGTDYEIRTQVRGLGSALASSTLSATFKTLPSSKASPNFRIAVGTCQDFPDRDGPFGFNMYRSMLKRQTDLFIMAGDVVYYDKLARSPQLAYYHWQQTYGLPTLVSFHRQVPTYFLKDDHDTYVNDSWPGEQLPWTEDFTFKDGQKIFVQETGLPAPAYRTFQVGKHLQVWLMEGRDYRSPNNAPDGPEKSIWGVEQKAWLARTLQDSTAKFRLIISPTPLVGPDRDNKHDNHSNDVFATEGQEVRKLLASYPNLVSICGDRHWQYHSVDPQTGLHEFSVGPASDRHAGGWNPSDFREGIHQFLRVAGGYLEIELAGGEDAPALTLRHLDTLGTEQHRHILK